MKPRYHTLEFESAKQRVLGDPEVEVNAAEVTRAYGFMFHPSNLDGLTREDFKSFLLFKNNKHWGGIFRSGNELTTDMPKLIEALKVLLNESVPIAERLEFLVPRKGPKFIRGWDKGIITPILMVT